MARFYFHIREGDVVIEDPDGSELPDLRAAELEAALSARALVVERILAGKCIGDRVLEVADSTGRVLATVSLRSSVGI